MYNYEMILLQYLWNVGNKFCDLMNIILAMLCVEEQLIIIIESAQSITFHC